jgi:TPR repeat protein
MFKPTFLLSLLWALTFFGAGSLPVYADDPLLLGQKALRDQNFDAALGYFRRSALKGDPGGQCALGLMYENGYGIEKDYTKAKLWFDRSARKGDPGGQNNLGFLYHSGLGVKRDDATAITWFTKAADQGLASAQMNLALMAARGDGMPKELNVAFTWFHRAALQGDEEAQVNLGQMCSLGDGTPKDLVESYKWFLIALKHDDLDEEKIADLHNDLEWLDKRMTGDQTHEAHKRAEMFKATSEPQEDPSPTPAKP